MAHPCVVVSVAEGRAAALALGCRIVTVQARIVGALKHAALGGVICIPPHRLAIDSDVGARRLAPIGLVVSVEVVIDGAFEDTEVGDGVCE